MRKVEVSPLVRRRMLSIKKSLTDRFGEDTAFKAIVSITNAMENLGVFPEKGVRISQMYSIESDYYYLFHEHNYIVYRFDNKKVIILRLFDEKEDFMLALFGISGRTQESIDYWGE